MVRHEEAETVKTRSYSVQFSEVYGELLQHILSFLAEYKKKEKIKKI